MSHIIMFPWPCVFSVLSFGKPKLLRRSELDIPVSEKMEDYQSKDDENDADDAISVASALAVDFLFF